MLFYLDGNITLTRINPSDSDSRDAEGSCSYWKVDVAARQRIHKMSQFKYRFLSIYTGVHLISNTPFVFFF